ncbi:MAG TPA: acetate--CoA ligase family protein [Baekduia sp.]|nr:acetate--CoA ligase family protein [Baekduia sp.]
MPRSVVLVGASDRTPRAAATTRNVLGGEIPAYAINPTRDDVAGFPAFAAFADLPEVPELAMLAVGHARIEAAFEDAIAAGVRSFVVPGLGHEAGPGGPEIAARLATRAAELDVPLLGPNCMGLARPGRTSVWMGSVPESAIAGSVSVVVQSGSVGEALLSCGPRIGFGAVVTLGAELSRDIADLLAYFASDEETRAIGVFLEAVRRPAAFMNALALCAEAGKPVVCLKAGRSSAAERTALAHTGAVVGSARTLSSVLRRFGVIEVMDFQDLVETLDVLGAPRWPGGTRVAAVSDSGGESALLADHAEAAGIPFEPIAETLVDRLRAEVPIPDSIPVVNPLDGDFGGDYEDVLNTALSVLARSGEYDAVLAAIDSSQFRGVWETEVTSGVVPGLARAIEGTSAFGAAVSIHASDPPPEIVELAREHRVPLLRGYGNAMRAVAAVASWHAAASEGPAFGEPVSVDCVDWRDGPLSEFESAEVLERYGVQFAPRRRASSPAAAAEAARELGFPVVVKVHGPAHKAVDGGVVLGVETADAAAAAAERLGGDVIVASQIPSGPEILCGMTRDEDYGPLLAVGVGGRAVEALGLAAVALGPLGEEAALELVAEAPGVRELADAGAQQVIARTLVALSRLAHERPDVLECEVNPLIVADGQAVAVDALIVIGSTAGTEG